jgi:hypothetical protein
MRRHPASLSLPLLLSSIALALACGPQPQPPPPDEQGEESVVIVWDDESPGVDDGELGGEDGDGDGQESPSAPPDAVEPPRPDLPSGGYLEATRFVSADQVSRSALAELWSGFNGPAEAGRLMYENFPTDACFSIPGAATTPTFYDFVDVGDRLTLRGDDRVELDRELIFSNIFYKAYGDLSGLSGGATYDVEHGGGAWQDALRMPADPIVHAPSGLAAGFVDFRGQDGLELDLAVTGADRLYLILQRDDDGVVCRLADDGHFTLSQQAIAGAPEWGTLVVLAINRTWVEHEGRAVEIIGTNGLVAQFER